MADVQICVFLLLLLLGCCYTHYTAVPQLDCSYTFLVQKQGGTECPKGAVDFDEADIDVLKTVIRNQQEQLTLLSQEVRELKEQIKEAPKEESGNDKQRTNITSGTNYVRWGRTVCPDTAELVYWGYAAGSHYTHGGGGSNYLCLDNNPQWPETTVAGFQSSGHVYGVEYQANQAMDSSLLDNDAPCAVCHVNVRGEQLMIPGNRTCPERWTKEYEGILVADAYTHKRSTYVCLDKDAEVVAGGGPNTNGALFYAAESTCTALPCPPFVDGFEIACVVCTL